MTISFAITGLDGTGKTTLVRRLAGHAELLEYNVRSYHQPKHYLDQDLPLGRLGRALDKLASIADEAGNAPVKAVSMFLILTMTGSIERHLRETYAPRLILNERQALVDSLVYAKCYLPLLKRALPESEAEALFARHLTTEDRASIDDWLRVLGRRLGLRLGLWTMAQTLHDIFSAESHQLLTTLKLAYQTDFPTHLLLLTADRNTFQRRLTLKHAAGEAAEVHENADLLFMLQGFQIETCKSLKTVAAEMRVAQLDVSYLSADEVESAALALLKNALAGENA